MSAVERIQSIRWFASVGMPAANPCSANASISTWDDAVESCRTPAWEQFTLNRVNELTLHLNRTCKIEYQKWNSRIRSVKDQLSRTAWLEMRRLLTAQSIPVIVADCVEWDTLHASMVDLYSAFGPPQFFLDLLQVYERGHFPCGWRETVSGGDLLVF
jgi:hypothetical protein